MKIKVGKKNIEVKKDATALEIAAQLKLTAPDQALCVLVNGKLFDLSYKPEENEELSFISFKEDIGKAVFWHTSSHVLAQAVKRLYPNAKPTIGPSIEKGFYYDFADLSISEKDFPQIEKEVKKIITENLKPQKKEFSKKDIVKYFTDNPFKQELIKEIKEETVTGYKQGDFFDLCRGPHLPNIGKIKSFKILKTSGAYWRGDSKNPMLTRIYGISFPEKEMLKEYLYFLEEAKKRDHKMLGQTLDLFSFKEEAPGMVVIHPKGMYIWNTLLNFLRNLLDQAEYQEIKTPILMSKELWEKSGHWFHYRENMYLSDVEKKEYAIKPMNCPGCMLFYKTRPHSYRELPIRISEIGHVHRHEPSGALNGLFRVRSFHQDDAHIFMRKEDIKDEIINILNLANTIYMTFGLAYTLELSTRPEKEKTIGTDEDWELSTKALKKALDEWDHSYKINEGEGAFYGPKIDIHIQDAIGRSWQCGTIQMDMSLPKKFDIKYVDADGKQKQPITLHRALFGSIERFFGILIEHFAGKFPLWISPNPIIIIPVADRHIAYAEQIEKKIKEKGFLCSIERSHESVSKKIRNSQLLKINYMITLGDKEIEKKTLSLRTRGNKVIKDVNIEDFIKKIEMEKLEKRLISPYEII